MGGAWGHAYHLLLDRAIYIGQGWREEDGDWLFAYASVREAFGKAGTA